MVKTYVGYYNLFTLLVGYGDTSAIKSSFFFI